jgi:hypothetical protein
MASIPFLIGVHRTHRPLREAVPQQQQQATPTAPVAPAPPAPTDQQQPNGIDWQAFKSKLSALISQPQTDSQAVMQLIADMLGQTPVGSADRQQMINLIKAFQTNQTMVAKVPQIQQISLESRLRSGKMLQEAPPRTSGAPGGPPASSQVNSGTGPTGPNTATAAQTTTPTGPTGGSSTAELKRSELDKIFMEIAQFLAHQRIINPGLFPQQQQAPQSNAPQGQQQAQPNPQGQALTLNTYAAKNITQNAIDRAKSSMRFRPSDGPKWLDPVKKKLDELLAQPRYNGRVDFGTLMKEFDRELANQRSPLHITDMPQEIQDILINAASNGQ